MKLHKNDNSTFPYFHGRAYLGDTHVGLDFKFVHVNHGARVFNSDTSPDRLTLSVHIPDELQMSGELRALGEIRSDILDAIGTKLELDGGTLLSPGLRNERLTYEITPSNSKPANGPVNIASRVEAVFDAFADSRMGKALIKKIRDLETRKGVPARDIELERVVERIAKLMEAPPHQLDMREAAIRDILLPLRAKGKPSRGRGEEE